MNNKKEKKFNSKAFFAFEKAWYKRWWTWLIALITVAVIISVPFIINYAYLVGLNLTDKNTAFSASDMLNLYGGILSFIGTIVLGIVATWQTKKAHSLNEKLQGLEDNRENEKLLEMYFSFMEQAGKIFDPFFIVGDFSRPRENLEIFFAIKNCNQNALSIKRRLLLLDSKNSGNDFFEYAMNLINEIIQIAIKHDDNGELAHEVFVFMQNNSDDFNQKSLLFISKIYKSIYGKNFI